MKRTTDNILLCVLLIWATIAGVMMSAHVLAADPALTETRCCVIPERNADGSIKRRADVLRAFRKIHPCPSTGLTTGSCTGWAIDHVLPISLGFVDSVSNLQWLPNVLKLGTGIYPKDRWERKINANPQILVIMPIGGILTVIEK